MICISEYIYVKVKTLRPCSHHSFGTGTVPEHPQPERVRSIFAGVNATRTSGTGPERDRNGTGTRPERDRNANRNRCDLSSIWLVNCQELVYQALPSGWFPAESQPVLSLGIPQGIPETVDWGMSGNCHPCLYSWIGKS